MGVAGFQEKKQKCAKFPEAQDHNWDNVISTTRYWPKKVTKAAEAEGARNLDSTFWWEKL